ncbi:dihydropyrimidinase [Clostridium sp.]|uniref:dihydropyrimidinase n=1 Tax=Clostridium sp. TaxID=1506 RepID=UPI002FC8DC71
MKPYIIKNGTIITASDTVKGDLFIDEGIIKEVGINIEKNNCEIIDAMGKYVIPGGVDVHTHFDLDVGISRAVDDFYTGSVAAACGGTTTIVDHMAFGPKGCNLKHQIEVYHKLAEDKAVIDYSFHGVIQHVNDEILAEIEEIVDSGIPSFKLYLTYDFKVNDDDAFKVISTLGNLGGITTVHCENNDIINYLRSYYSSKGLYQPIYHAKSRPVEAEGEAVNRIINIAAMAKDAPLYIVHLSTKLGLQYIKTAKERGQKNIFAETCPQYLILDEEEYNLPNNEGLKFIMSPPLRQSYNKEALWNGIKDGHIQVVATDHCPFNFKKEKQMGIEDFTKCPNGAPGVETRMALLFSEGVSKNRISINKFVEITCTNPAKIFGLYPKKGTIAVGSDADIVILDPHKEFIITKSMLHENVDYTPYEGIKVIGYPELTMVRGAIVAKNNEFVGKKGLGKFIKRSRIQV